MADEETRLGSTRLEDVAEIADGVGKMERHNYLAHTIRHIEHKLLTLNEKPYRVIAHPIEKARETRIEFANDCCDIFLDHTCEYRDDRDLRLMFAHELGHLVFNFGKIKGDVPSHSGKDASVEQEAFAWAFAYHLILTKSEEYKKIGYNQFVYDPNELKATLFRLMGEIRQDADEIRELMERHLKRATPPTS
jgi:hypothetical protein